MMPGTGPSAPQTVIRWPISTCGSQPPMGWTKRNPSSSMCWTIRPIWSQWPASMTRNGAPAIRDGDHVAVHVGADFVGKRADVIADDLLHGLS